MKTQSTLLIVDTQSVKNTDTAGYKSYDAGKKVSGIKRLFCWIRWGLLHAVQITTAEVTDRKRALEAIGHSNAAAARALVVVEINQSKPTY